MKTKHILVFLCTVFLLTGCASLLNEDNTFNQSLKKTDSSLHGNEDLNIETPIEFEARNEDLIKEAVHTEHEGTLQDPVPVGEYNMWAIVQSTPVFDEDNSIESESTDYLVDMKVNYSVRGEKALELYNYYAREENKREALTSSYYHDDYKDYVPESGNELMIINVSFGVMIVPDWLNSSNISFEKTKPLTMRPTFFDIITSSGVEISEGSGLFNYFEYYNLLDYKVYPGGEGTSYVVYEVPKNKEIYIGLTGVWFKTE